MYFFIKVETPFSLRVRLIWSLFFLSFLLVNCSHNRDKNLIFQITWEEYSGKGDVIQRVVNDFNETHRGIHVEMVGGREESSFYEDVLEEGAADVLALPYRFIHREAIGDHLFPLGTIEDERKNFFNNEIFELGQFRNQQLGIPWIGHSMALIYNKDMTDSAGLDPTTWRSMDELLEGSRIIGEKLDHGGLGMIGADHHDITWMVSQFIYSFGGKLVDYDSEGHFSAIAVNSKESAEALDFYINKLGKYGQPNWQNHNGMDVMDVFSRGEIAFEIQGPWGVSDIWKRGFPFDIGVIPLRQMGMFSEVGPLMLSLSKNTPNSRESLLFIEYLTEKENLMKIMGGEYIPKYDGYYPFRVPLRKDMIGEDFFAQYPNFLPFIEGFSQISVSSPCEEWEQRETQFSLALHRIVLGELNIKKALEEMEK